MKVLLQNPLPNQRQLLLRPDLKTATVPKGELALAETVRSKGFELLKEERNQIRAIM